MSEISADSVPLTVSVDVGGVLVNRHMGRQSAYAAAARGDLPVIAFGRRRYVSLPKLQEKLGRPITSADVAAAEALVAARKQKAKSAAAQ